MTIDVHKREGVNRFKLTGNVTIGSGLGVALQETFDELLASGERVFVFDMTETRYLDSAGLGAIMGCHKKAARRGGRIRLVIDEQSTTRELLALTHLDRVLDVSSDQSDGLAGISGSEIPTGIEGSEKNKL